MPKRKLPPQFELLIEDMAISGEGRGLFRQRPVYVYGVCPGDRVSVRPVKVNKREAKAALVEVVEPSPIRRPALDPYYAGSSPWQVMPEEEQLTLKQRSVRTMFKDKAGCLPLDNPGITAVEPFRHYRNKMEYCFTRDEEGRLSLGVFERFRHSRRVAVEGSSLAHHRMNECARGVIRRMREKDIPPEILKHIIFRYSWHEDKCLAVLYVVDEDFPVFDVDDPFLAGWMIIFSDPLSPASKVTRVLHVQDRDYLIETIGGKSFKFFYDSFFQAHVPAFERLLAYVRQYCARGQKLVDIYSGVGTLGLSLADKFEEVYCLEGDKRAVEAARQNIRDNGLHNARARALLAEDTDFGQWLGDADTVVVDPPRGGCHPKFIRALARRPVRQLVYVSCNPLTQALDFARLKEVYKPCHWHLFDLYPQTPHVESVLIMG